MKEKILNLIKLYLEFESKTFRLKMLRKIQSSIDIMHSIDILSFDDWKELERIIIDEICANI